jgi:hypothetical protein
VIENVGDHVIDIDGERPVAGAVGRAGRQAVSLDWLDQRKVGQQLIGSFEVTLAKILADKSLPALFGQPRSVLVPAARQIDDRVGRVQVHRYRMQHGGVEALLGLGRHGAHRDARALSFG